MVGRIQSGFAVGLSAMLLLGVWAGNGLAAQEPPKAPAAGAQPAPAVKTPEEQRADEYLQRFRQEEAVKRHQNVFMADNLVRLAKDRLEMGDIRGAMHDYEKAAQLDDTNKDAQQGFRRTRSMLNVEDKRFGDIAADYSRQRAIALDVQKTELNNMYADAKTLFDKGQYRDSIEAFTRVQARAIYLSPNIDIGKIAEESGQLIQKAMTKIEEKRMADAGRSRVEAEKASTELRVQRQKLIDERNNALYKQATTLFEQHRYEEARKACDEILLKDPSNGSASTLRESAVSAGQNEEIDRALKARKVETEREWNLTRAMQVPQAELVYMPRDKFEEVRNRKPETSFGGDRVEAPPWEAKIREAMNKKISFDFVETPLQDVVTFISSLVDVTIVLDTEAVKEEPKTVTLRVNDMRLESAINWVLKLVGLKYTLKDEAVFVSKPDRIYDKPVMRMYDVTDLTIDIKNFQGRQQALASDGGYSSTGSGGGGSGGGGGGGGESLGRDFFGAEGETKAEEDKLTGQTLVDFIKRTIAAGTWSEDELGGAK
jgi:tetratricopeptide (TPR) repeat protein